MQIKLFIDGCHTDFRVEIPVTLGSIPLKQRSSTAPQISILAGLGTPYPHETSQNANVREQKASYVLSNEYGWMIG